MSNYDACCCTDDQDFQKNGSARFIINGATDGDGHSPEYRRSTIRSKSYTASWTYNVNTTGHPDHYCALSTRSDTRSMPSLDLDQFLEPESFDHSYSLATDQRVFLEVRFCLRTSGSQGFGAVWFCFCRWQAAETLKGTRGEEI